MHQNWPARGHVVSTPGNLIHLEVPLGSKDLSFSSVQASRHWRLYPKGSIALNEMLSEFFQLSLEVRVQVSERNTKSIPFMCLFFPKAFKS